MEIIEIYRNYKKLWIEINSKRKLQFFALMVLTLVTSLMEVFSLGAVLPLIGFLLKPEKIKEIIN